MRTAELLGCLLWPGLAGLCHLVWTMLGRLLTCSCILVPLLAGLCGACKSAVGLGSSNLHQVSTAL